MPRKPDLDAQAQAVIFAAVYGDEAACKRYGITDRSLRRHREKARTPGTDLSDTVRRYADAMRPPEAVREDKAAAFAVQLSALAMQAGALFMEKAQEAKGVNPASLDAIREFVAVLLENVTAADYVTRLFGSGPGTVPSAAPASPSAPAAPTPDAGDDE